MEFSEDSVLDLLNLCNQDKRLGGACGRTHPIGRRTGPLVWYQKFEYAKGDYISNFCHFPIITLYYNKEYVASLIGLYNTNSTVSYVDNIL